MVVPHALTFGAITVDPTDPNEVHYPFAVSNSTSTEWTPVVEFTLPAGARTALAYSNCAQAGRVLTCRLTPVAAASSPDTPTVVQHPLLALVFPGGPPADLVALPFTLLP